jgi:hypothetical protein
MSLVVWCPQCKLPLTADECAGGLCAMCGVTLMPAAPPVADAADPGVLPPPNPLAAPAYPRRLLWAMVALQLLTLTFVGVALARRPPAPAASGDPNRHADDRTNREEPPTPAEKRPPETAQASTRDDAPKHDIFGPPESLKGAAAVAAIKPVIFGPPEELKAPPRPIRPPALGNEVKLDDADGDYALESLQGGKTLKLTGKVRRLTVGQVSDRAVLDASKLEAKEVVVLRGVLNEATLKVSAADGAVEFRGSLAGRAKVFVNAPGGAVTFREKGGTILNEARLDVTARSLDFQDRIEGANTLVTATLTAGARLKYHAISSGAKVYVKRADPKDPPAEVSGGDVYAQGEFRRLN